MTAANNFLSARIEACAPSATMAMTQAARELRAQGRDIISLSAGEPDFDTPAHICTAATRAMKEGHTGYTAVDGIAALKSAIIGKFKRDNGLDYTSSQINVSPGGKPVLFNALAVTLNPGDEVIIPTPCWVSYPDMVRLNGGTPVMVSCSATDGYKLTPNSLAEAITPRSKWLILNSPGNPTGAAYSADELSALAEVLRDHPQLMVLSDDIYEHLVYGDFKFATLAQIAPDLKTRTLTMNGVSKAYAMTGWRIGYAGGPDWLIRAMSRYMGQTTSNPSSISQWAAVEALSGPQDFLNDWRAEYQARRDFVVSATNHIPGLSCDTPDGAFYAFVRTDAVDDGDDAAFAITLLQEAGVASVPGSAFYAPGHIRLSYAASMAELEAAMARLKDFVKGR